MVHSFTGMTRVGSLVALAGFALAGCGSGSSGSADLDQGGSVVGPPPAVTVTESFDFSAPGGSFVVGTPPVHARFSGGVADNNGAWIIRSGQTGVIDFGTPADLVKFSTQDKYVAAAGASASQKPSLRAPSQAVDPPFNVSMYLRGLNEDWNAVPARRFAADPTVDNLLSLSLDLTTAILNDTFKVADAGWAAGTDCGKKDADTITIGAPFALDCGGGLGKEILLTIPKDAKYKFTLDVRDAANPTLTLAEDTGDDNGGGGEVPKDSTEVRVYAVDTLTEGAQPQLVSTTKGLGLLDIDEIKERTGGSPRITRIEIENLGTAGDIGIEDITWTADARFALDPVQVDIVYRRPLAGQTNGTRIKVGSATYDCVPDDEFQCVVRDLTLPPYSNAEMTVTNADGSVETIQFNAGGGSDFDDDPADVVFAVSGAPTARTGVPGEGGGAAAALPRNANEVILFYKRADNDYEGWGLHLFPTDPQGDAWTEYAAPYFSEGIDPQWGAYFRIALPGQANPAYSNNPAATDTFPTALGLVIHRMVGGRDVKDPAGDLVIRIAEQGNMVFVTAPNANVGTVPPGSGATFVGINGAIAHWVNSSTIVTATAEKVTGESPIQGLTAQLLYSPDGSIRGGPSGIVGTFEAFDLASAPLPTSAELPNQKHLTKVGDYVAWTLPLAAVNKAKSLARGQLIVRVKYADGTDYFGTQVQIPGALDALYADAASTKPLGVSYASGVPSLAVWAPTALTVPGVSVNLYDANGTRLTTVPMTLDESTGIWSVTGQADWDRKFYTLSLRVYSYAVNAVVTNEVTDPYSVSLSTDSVRSQFVNLKDADLKPAGWDALTLPPLAAPEDLTLFELHVRDFSIADSSVPAADRGKFTAFDIPNTAGRQHLQELADAGLTGVHILPPFDFATVRENPADRVELDDPVEKLCAANPDAADLCSTAAGKTIRQAMQESVGQFQSDRPQTQDIAEWLRDLDGFNWGYDPLHFNVPEGSYSTNPNGPQRILEFRRMVKGLGDVGLRTVMDVVYNHTNASGQGSKSVLDRVVPGYYHRRDPISGSVLRNSCCEDTAAEFRMMEKLIVDTGESWVREYKIAGFRFDAMWMHPLGVMQNFKAAVQAIDPSVYVYGEGWNGESPIKNDAWFLQARQANLGGSGIGSFSDRIRDPIRGGAPFDSGEAHVRNQGFISGQFYDPNATVSDSALLEAARTSLIRGADNSRLWMAGGLSSYMLVNYLGNTVAGSQVDYAGQPSGYTLDPSEAINYIAKHDNETLWDISQYKHPEGTPLSDRRRADSVGMSMILLGQGIPFWQAGTEILRSKSMDRNSYDSGDWYNEIDWTLATSKWNQGLPLESDNRNNYPQVMQVSADPTAAQDQDARQRAFDVFKEFLRIRYSSNLFRMPTQELIKQRLVFLDTGPTQVPGLIAMRLEGCTEPGSAFVPTDGGLVVVFNATDGPRTLGLYRDEGWSLHPVQAASVDPVVRTARHDASGFTVPARTTAVFRRDSQGSCAPFAKEIFLRGLGTDWTDSPANQMEFKGGTRYERVKGLAAGPDPDGFKIASSDWASVDCGSAIPVTFGARLPLVCNGPGNSNIGMTVGAAGEYVFNLDAASTTAPILTVVQKPAFHPTDLYVRGIAGDWDANDRTRMTAAAVDGDVYRATLSVPAGADEFGFKIASEDWATVDCGSSTAVTIGQPLALVCNAAGNGNVAINFPTAGQYLFMLDAENRAAPVLTVEKAPFGVDIFVRGVGTDWSDSPYNRLQYQGGAIYRVYKTASAGPDPEGFKIASQDWTTVDCGSSTPLTIGQPLALVCNGPGNGNIDVSYPQAGTYLFSLDATNPAAPSLTVTGP